MTVRTNVVRINIDKNPEFPHVINTDLLREIAAEAFDWRLLVWDPDQDDDDGVLDEMYESIEAKLRDASEMIGMACNSQGPIFRRDILDVMDFIWVIEFETAYVGTVSTYTDAVMISYEITELNGVDEQDPT